MRVLVSAYACEPGAGSEPGVGWEWSRAAARAGHEVWVVTRRNNRAAIEAALARENASKLTFVYLDLPRSLRRWKRGQRGIRRYYVLWQQLARRRMIALHGIVGFDVAHHLTFATDWLPAAATAVPGLPAVWGPVGGATPMPRALYRYLGPRGTSEALARELVGRAGRRVWGDGASRRAAVILALNPDVAGRFGRPGATVMVEPNSAFDLQELRGRASAVRAQLDGGQRWRAVMVGRLTPWKGAMLAIDALADPAASAWDLDIYGGGPDRGRLEREISTRGLRGRVRMHGQVPRAQALQAMSEADALLHPAFHDSSPWTVGEAVTLGVPVVCLDHGGPPTLAAPGQMYAVPAGRATAKALAGALQKVKREPKRCGSDRWSRDRLPALLDEVYEHATGGIDGHIDPA